MTIHVLYVAFGIALGTYGATGHISHKLHEKLLAIIVMTNITAFFVSLQLSKQIDDISPQIIVEYSTMAKACRDCPYNRTDCYNRGCITAGGEVREIQVANHMLPGPSVQVCEGDTIQVELENDFGSDSASIHWHGMHQKDTPFMDGVPYLIQCPIPPQSTFVYSFLANPIGTHMWHSHVGIQEPDGFFGSVVVRSANDTLAKYYDYDLAEHVMVIWHWYGQPTTSIIKSTFFRTIVALGHGFVINGMSATENYTMNGVNYTTPRANFTVKQGYRYRFRSIANMAIYCPIQVSVDNHTLLIIASDGSSVKPVEVESFIINAGERYDFVLTADQPDGNYWIKYRGLGNCAISSTFGLAILHYEDATFADPSESVTFDDTDRSGTLLNPVGLLSSFPDNTLIKLTELENTSGDAADVSGEPDNTFYWTIALNTYNQFQTPGPYAQIDNLSFDFPQMPILTQYREFTDDMTCMQGDFSNADCIDTYCTCPIIYSVELGSLVEMVFIDNSTRGNDNHPFHMHGGYFRVVAMENGNSTQTLEDIKARNENGSIYKNFDTAPQKDAVGIPAHGFAVLRFKADNPGYWFFHCHVTVHAEEGMGLVLKVGKDSEMVHPHHGFPTCGNYKPKNTRLHHESS